MNISDIINVKISISLKQKIDFKDIKNLKKRETLAKIETEKITLSLKITITSLGQQFDTLCDNFYQNYENTTRELKEKSRNKSEN